MNTVKCQTKHESSLKRLSTNRIKKLEQYIIFEEKYLLHHTLVLFAPFFLPVWKPGSQPQLRSHSVCLKVVY